MAIHSIHHASLLVADVHASLVFYTEVLGLAVDERRPDLGYAGAWLRIGEQQVHLLQLPNTHAVQPDLHGGRDFHIAFHMTGLTDLQNKLVALGVPLSLSKSGRKALFCRDPDGNALEFIEVTA